MGWKKYKRQEKQRKLIAKVLRFLCITKEIELSKYDIFWIKFCKNHFKDKFESKGDWVENLKEPFVEIYAYSPEEHYNDFLGCMFNKLLDVHLKIQDDQSGTNRQLKDIFSASFAKWLHRSQEQPIERAIAALCGEIQCNQVVKYGVKRYDLNKEFDDELFKI